MCILVHAVKRQPIEIPMEQRISNALVEVGPSITLASLSEVLAFAVGGFISMPASRVFSMFAGQTGSVNVLIYFTRLVLNNFNTFVHGCSYGCPVGLPPSTECFCSSYCLWLQKGWRLQDWLFPMHQNILSLSRAQQRSVKLNSLRYWFRSIIRFLCGWIPWSNSHSMSLLADWNFFLL